jgi:hypothetical protein
MPKMFRLTTATMAAGMVLGVMAKAQSTPSGGEVVSNGSLLHTMVAAPVIGQPYSATQVHRTVRKLADGTTITHAGHHFVARDSAGRVRVEMRMANGQNGGPDTVLVFVSDPVARTVTTFMIGPKVNKLASVAKMPEERKQAVAAVPVAATHESARPQPVVTSEDLGIKTLQGLPVSDVRTTTIVPAGRSGNDAPITKTREVWTSQDLKLVMKEQWEDPRSGEKTVELDDFSRSEPDAALFHAPKGYEVKNALESLKELEAKLEAAQN